MANTQTTYRRKAKELGISWETLLDTYRELRVHERQSRERAWKMRRRAWKFMTSEGCHGFWRHGFQARYPKAFGEGDRENIPGFDVCSQVVAAEFPELNQDNDPAEALFDFLSQPHDKLPSSEETWEEAIEIILNNPSQYLADSHVSDDELANVPF